jgi:cytochrome d ubiquinol oxidase subunit I
LSRLQFAAATYFHFLFVPVTLGLSIFIAIMESRFVHTGDQDDRRAARFWGKLFLINFAVGLVTGITLEFQFGTNWARYSAYVGDVFGSLLAIEATAAFFLESTFIGVWAFGWNKLSPKAHAVVAWLVAFGSNLSAIWILTANSWMQHPVGYVIRNGRAELTDFWAILGNPTAHLTILHTLSGAYVQAAFLVAGICAWHLLKRREVRLFKESMRVALGFGLIFSLVQLGGGHLHAMDVAKIQPAKLAAMESHWDTRTHAPIYALTFPDQKNGRNHFEWLPMPSMLSLLAFGRPDAEVKGLADIPVTDRPPVAITFVAFRLMVGLGMLFIALLILGNLLLLFDWAVHVRAFLWVMLLAIPLPYAANLLGWTVTEVGRQPWIVYGVMRTTDGVSNIEPTQILITLIGFVVVYGLLGLFGFYLLGRAAGQGPEPAVEPVAAAEKGGQE